ncbi:SH3 domain-containing protein [Eubacterium sp. AB3007]|uniref:SH3 domain-containing protein n=1 Tax=Eubacterium sp. AB3007 TaxID=1392487 RepID=UPI0004807B3B|nr:SH3 domain-containing protein [Eubacterium sp. AB3007]
MKKLAAMLLSVMMVFLFTACGGGNNDSEPAPADEPTPQTSEVSGIVEDLTDGELSIYTQAKESLTFNIENAEIDTEDSIESGDTATVEYTGKISDGHTEDCEVSKVTNEKGTESKLEGKVKEISQASGSIMITSDNKDYLFDVSDAREEAAKAAVGATVELKYTGLLENTDTTHAYMKTLKVTKAPEKKRIVDTVKVKAVDEKVWTTKKVKIMDDASKDAKKLGKVKKGTKLKRTGVLENGWSRVVYKDKDAFVKTKTLSTKKPKAKKDKKIEEAVTEEKAQEEQKVKTDSSTGKAEEAVAEESKKSAVEEGDQTTEEEKPAAEEEPPAEEEKPAAEEEKPTEEAQAEPEEEAEPKTLTDKGVCEDLDEKTIKLDNGNKYKIKDAKFEISPADDAIGQKVKVEYTEGTDKATRVYLADGAKAPDEAGSGTSPVAWIVGVIIVAAIAAIIIVRKRRKV